jgi:CHAT domain-containing protein
LGLAPDGGTARGLDALPGGLAEIDNMRRCLGVPSSNVLFDGKTQRQRGVESADDLATPENFLRRAPTASLIHLVAHGVYDASAPMRSKLFLDRSAGGRRTVEASELLALDLHRTSLVTLASCQTGLSGLMPGAEPIGFVRSLLGAGAKSVILTAWEVDDRTSSGLFSELYCGLGAARTSEALRRSQLAVRRRQSHPYFWAGVSLYGSAN